MKPAAAVTYGLIAMLLMSSMNVDAWAKGAKGGKSDDMTTSQAGAISSATTGSGSGLNVLGSDNGFTQLLQQWWQQLQQQALFQLLQQLFQQRNGGGFASLFGGRLQLSHGRLRVHTRAQEYAHTHTV